VSKVSKADRKAGFPDKVKVVTEEKMVELLNNVEDFIQAMVSEASSITSTKILKLLEQFRLLPEQIYGRCTLVLKEQS
jgi:hypothetical protein